LYSKSEQTLPAWDGGGGAVTAQVS
jgi:hypothetical protein